MRYTHKPLRVFFSSGLNVSTTPQSDGLKLLSRISLGGLWEATLGLFRTCLDQLSDLNSEALNGGLDISQNSMHRIKLYIDANHEPCQHIFGGKFCLWVVKVVTGI